LEDDYIDVIKRTISAFEIKFIKKTWIGEPSLYGLKETISEVENFKPDLILAVGGGSIIDGAKIVRTLYEFPFYDPKTTNFKSLNWSTKFVVIPTTMGSGAETSSSAVLYNQQENTKEFVVTHAFIPEVVVFDAKLIQNSSRKIILLSTMDALSHIVEGTLSKIENPLMDLYAEKALQIIQSNYMVLTCDEEIQEDVINQLQFAAFYAGMVQNHCIVGAAHAIAHQLTSYGFGHAEAISLILPEAIKANLQSPEVKLMLTKLANNAGINEGFNGIINFIEKIVSQIDLKDEKALLSSSLNSIYENDLFFNNALSDAGGKGNPITMDKTFLVDILRNVELQIK
jgi:alcohol dehydrogenase class IV